MMFRYGVNCGEYESRTLNSPQEDGRDYMKERENSRSWKKNMVKNK